jgi:hypothetical protein
MPIKISELTELSVIDGTVVVPVIERIARNILASLEGKPLPSPRDEELSLF